MSSVSARAEILKSFYFFRGEKTYTSRAKRQCDFTSENAFCCCQVYLLRHRNQQDLLIHPTLQENYYETFDPFLLSFLLSSSRAVRSYRPHLEKRDLIWRKGTSFGGKRPHLEERDLIWRKGTSYGGKRPHLEERDLICRKGASFGGKGPHLEERDLICGKGAPFEAMTGRTVLSSDGLLAEVF